MYNHPSERLIGYRASDEELAIANRLAEGRGKRLAQWGKDQYLQVLSDLIDRLGYALRLELMNEYRAEKDLAWLDTYVINLAARAVARGVLEDPTAS